MSKVLVIHGPNLNMLGIREQNIYGSTTLEDVNHALLKRASQHNIFLECVQYNSETDIIQSLHKSYNDCFSYIIMNPGAYTHTSIVIRDALLMISIPFVEVHISNIYNREDFRRKSYFSDIASAVIVGCGVKGYEYALQFVIQQL